MEWVGEGRGGKGGGGGRGNEINRAVCRRKGGRRGRGIYVSSSILPLSFAPPINWNCFFFPSSLSLSDGLNDKRGVGVGGREEERPFKRRWRGIRGRREGKKRRIFPPSPHTASRQMRKVAFFFLFSPPVTSSSVPSRLREEKGGGEVEIMMTAGVFFFARRLSSRERRLLSDGSPPPFSFFSSFFFCSSPCLTTDR